jgi:hypothetical protein
MALTLADIDNMPSAEYKQRLQNDPAFIAEVEQLFKGPSAPATVAAPGAAPQGEEIDPSMPDRKTTNGLPQSTSVRDRAERPAGAPAPVAPAPVAPVAPAPVAPAPVAEAPELVYEYQPMDEHNRPLGGKQVIKYRTPDELAKKLTEQNVLLVRKLRQVTRENRLGTSKENIPSEAARFEDVVEYKEKPLTADERFQLTQDLNDPEKFASARDRLLESAVGVSPAVLRDRLNDQQMTILQLRAKENFITFTQQHEFATGDLATDTENTQTLTDWMFKNKLAPTVDNYELACSHLRSAGLLSEAPVVQQVPVPQPQAVVPVESVAPKTQEPVVPESRIAPAEPVQPKRHSPVPSGLNDRVSSASGVSPVTANSVTLADIDKMSADEYKKAAKNPAFKELVNRLENEAIAKRRQRAGQV